MVNNTIVNKRTYLEAATGVKGVVQKEKEKDRKEAEQAKTHVADEGWKKIESKKVKRAPIKKTADLKQAASSFTIKGERQRTSTTIEFKCSADSCAREAASRYRCGGCKNR